MIFDTYDVCLLLGLSSGWVVQHSNFRNGGVYLYAHLSLVSFAEASHHAARLNDVAVKVLTDEV